ncbi:MAG: ribosome biogenesis GTP-binding protein YihA/YsxC [Verrucomicrobia bacterium]|nr:ribosome biogenesis GTP-binding protein YihA/YsxC [Verrucomicrobiota bacterium]
MICIRSAALLGSAPDLASCPPSELPEFAFIGRSNVGKSSLVNMLTRVQGLARVSDTPGKTRLINFFVVNESWSLVDLPGYGYAKVGRKDRAQFSSFVADYLQNRPNLRGTFVLIDSRLTPQKIDLDFLDWMVHCGVPFILIFTKTDKLSRAAAQANIDAFLLRLQEISQEAPPVLTSSSKLSHGRLEILGLIEATLAEASEEESIA